MGKLFCLMGKSSSGKDTIYKKLKQDFKYQLKTIVPYTTRPIRSGEKNGREYHFVSEERLEELQKAGKVIECRSYHTVHGIWSYFTVDDGQIRLPENNYLMIGTLEAYQALKRYYGKEAVVPLYVEVEDGERLSRALNRERKQAQPHYEELCRRFLADSSDFSEERLEESAISKRFENKDIQKCLSELSRYIQKETGCAIMSSEEV